MKEIKLSNSNNVTFVDDADYDFIMKPEEQRLAIVKAFPNIFRRPIGAGGWNYYNSRANRVLPCVDGDPLNDLNAMHEVEKLLDTKLIDVRSLYFDYLTLNADAFPDRFESHWAVCRATAAQRAEAFLKTLNLWKE